MKLNAENAAELARSEREILTNRLVLGTLAPFALFALASDAHVLLVTFALYLAANTGIYFAQKHSFLPPPVRWTGAILLDGVMGFFCMTYNPEAMAFVYPIYLWAILGNGFRYGVLWLIVSAITSAISFGAVIALTPMWQEHMTLSIALLCALIIIPGYCSTLIRKLSRAREQAEAANRAKSYFLASVSHELRTPLNAIIGYGTHLKELDMPRDQREMVEASVNAGEHLLFLIEQLLQVSTRQSSKSTSRNSDFRLIDIVADARDMIVLRAEEKGVAVHLQAEPMSDRAMHGPADALKNILVNLASNAVKFTDAGSVTIRCGFQGSEMWLEVEDTGIGIAPTKLAKIFEPFQQADETVLDRFGGTGLGLAICRQIADTLGGRVSVDSRVGLGSRFRYTGPAPFADADVSGETDAIGADAPTSLISFGSFHEKLAEEARALPGVVHTHVECHTAGELGEAVRRIELKRHDVAVIDASLAEQIDADDPLWRAFAAAGVAPVLLGGNNASLDDIRLRAEFATVIPPAPNFAALRSAVRIGCSFAARPGRHEPSHDADAPASRSTAPQRTPRRILVADDNRTNRAVMDAILSSAGHEVLLAEDGYGVLDVLEKERVDIALLDVNMPRMTGIEACRLWRQIEGPRAHLPMLGVTADATAETRRACLDAGMDRRLTKPVAARALLDAIDEACGSATPEAAPVMPDALGIVVPLVGTTEAGEIDGAQVAYLRSIGDARFLDGLLGGYIDDVEETRREMRRAIAARDVEAFRFAAHAFKGASNNVGAVRFAERCGALQSIGETPFVEGADQILAEVEAHLDRVLAEIASIRASEGKLAAAG